MLKRCSEPTMAGLNKLITLPGPGPAPGTLAAAPARRGHTVAQNVGVFGGFQGILRDPDSGVSGLDALLTGLNWRFEAPS